MKEDRISLIADLAMIFMLLTISFMVKLIDVAISFPAKIFTKLLK